MRRSHWVLAALFLSVCIMILVSLIPRSTDQQAGQVQIEPSAKVPAEAGGVAGPMNQSDEAQSGNISIAPGPLQKGVDASQVTTSLYIESAPDFPDFVPNDMTVRAGETVMLVFKNASSPKVNQMHNWVLVKPGSSEQVGTAGSQAGMKRQYLPESPDVLAHTWMLEPGQSDAIYFHAPMEPGDYPFICTYPGHNLNAGVLHVMPVEETAES